MTLFLSLSVCMRVFMSAMQIVEKLVHDEEMFTVIILFFKGLIFVIWVGAVVVAVVVAIPSNHQHYILCTAPYTRTHRQRNAHRNEKKKCEEIGKRIQFMQVWLLRGYFTVQHIQLQHTAPINNTHIHTCARFVCNCELSLSDQLKHDEHNAIMSEREIKKEKRRASSRE